MKSGLQTNETNYTVKSEPLNDPPADLSKLIKMIGNDRELLKKLFQIFIETYPGKLESLRRAVKDDDAEELEKVAHGLKGSVGNFGARLAFELAYELENMGRMKKLDGADEIINELQKDMERIKGYFLSKSQTDFII